MDAKEVLLSCIERIANNDWVITEDEHGTIHIGVKNV